VPCPRRLDPISKSSATPPVKIEIYVPVAQIRHHRSLFYKLHALFHCRSCTSSDLRHVSQSLPRAKIRCGGVQFPPTQKFPPFRFHHHRHHLRHKENLKSRCLSNDSNWCSIPVCISRWRTGLRSQHILQQISRNYYQMGLQRWPIPVKSPKLRRKSSDFISNFHKASQRRIQLHYRSTPPIPYTTTSSFSRFKVDAPTQIHEMGIFNRRTYECSSSRSYSPLVDESNDLTLQGDYRSNSHEFI
jgi:hypothetical protein